MKPEPFYGWRLLAALSVIYFLSIGTLYYGLSITLPEFITTFGWSRAEASTGFSITTLSMGLAGPLVAYAMNRFGVRRAMCVGGLVAAVGALNMYFTDSRWQYYLVVAPLLGLGIALQSIIPGNYLVSVWFKQRRSLAIGIFMASGGIARAVVVPCFAFVIETTGNWRLIWLMMALSSLLCAVVSGWLVRERPEDLGQQVDGGVSAEQPSTGRRRLLPTPAAGRVYRTEEEWTLRPALLTTALWMVIFCSAISAAGNSLVNSQGLFHLQDVGIDRITAASVIGLVGILSTSGRLISGLLGDYIDPRRLLGVGLGLIGLGIVILNLNSSIWGAYLFGCCFGLGNGLALVTTPAILANLFGSRGYASLAATRGVFSTLLSASVPLLAAWSFDLHHNYALAFWSYAAINLLGIGLILAVRPPRLSRQSDQAGGEIEASTS
ncbi:MAG: MFS transporter [Pseudomonadales bacterium]|nr:MFS transporter [Pseudomonadales bacterium]